MSKNKSADKKRQKELAKKRAQERETTGRVLAAMLRENTGRHLLDSGDAYGRHWERNQKRDFEKEPGAVLDIDAKYGGEISVTVRLYHFLLERVCRDERAAKLQEQFEQFAELPEHESEEWSETIEDFVNEIGGKPRYSGYTYNEENVLDQDFLYYVFRDSEDDAGTGDEMCFLQSHNGCDARGGFTKPQCFTLESDSELYGYDRATIACAEGHYWDLEMGYNGGWRNDEGKNIPNLETFEIVELENDETARASDLTKLGADWREYVALVNAERLPTLEGARPALPDGAAIFVENGAAHCPICGAILMADFWHI